MSERTDERTVGDEADVDLDGLADDGAAGGDVGFDDDELGVDVDALAGEPSSSPDSSPAPATGETERATGSSGPGLLSRLRPSIGRPSLFGGLPSTRDVGVALLVVVVSMVAGSMVPVLGSIGSLGGAVGVFTGAFALGLASGTSRYLELAFAAAVAAGLAAFLSSLQIALVSDAGIPLAAFGATTGLLAAMLGHYFGRDLRDGVTRSVDS